MNQFSHLFRIDEKTLGLISNTKTLGNPISTHTGVYQMSVNPMDYVHAYALLGNNAQRFGDDLRLYLATVDAFFKSIPTVTPNAGSKEIVLTGISSTDARRRLSEDLGVAMASLFVVNAFAVSWASISQIPANRKLSKKRPDFQAYGETGERVLFEAKGTTSIKSVEAALHRAINQVKGYPENAENKLAIVSYFSTEERLFPSQTFVVDPPALPDYVTPSLQVSRLLHGEKLLQFAGLPLSANAYLKALQRLFRHGKDTLLRNEQERTALRDVFDAECNESDIYRLAVDDSKYVGRRCELNSDSGAIYFGVQEKIVDSILELSYGSTELVSHTSERTSASSAFDDGSIVILN